MTRPQRIVGVLYCLLVVYCAIWVPWRYDAPALGVNGIKEGYALVWDGPPDGYGAPDMAAVASRVLAATGLAGAAFLLARRWKVLLLAGILACAGALLYGRWSDWIAERREIHSCAVARAATAMKCAPRQGQFQTCDPALYGASAHEEDEAVASAEKACAIEMRSGRRRPAFSAKQRKSAHEEIEEYREQHGVK
jgi:hypothetical protein